MLASVHLVDGGARATLAGLRRVPRPSDTPGLREARGLVAAPIGGRFPAPQPGRFGLVAFWDDAAGLDAFLASDLRAAALGGGWSARLEAVRAVPEAGGHFPGVPADLPTGPVDDDRPVAVLTIGLLRLGRAVPFLRASNRAERQVHAAPGLLWASGLANLFGPPVVATLSLWESGAQAQAYARSTSGHSRAMQEDGRRTFHHAGSFVRFRPLAATGHLEGRNPLAAAVTAAL